MKSVTPRVELERLVRRWEDDAAQDDRDSYEYRALLDAILFNADLRYGDYKQYRRDGEFPARLLSWINNLEETNEKQKLLKLLRWLIFIDNKQMEALYRDAFRRCVMPWLFDGDLDAGLLLDPMLEAALIQNLQGYRIYSLTESFSLTEFLHVNDLSALPRPVSFGGKPGTVKALLPKAKDDLAGLIVFEDFVGSGDQAARILKKVVQQAPRSWRILFVPLLLLERGRGRINQGFHHPNFTMYPVLEIPSRLCLEGSPVAGEHRDFAAFRTVVKKSAARVLEALSPTDDPTDNEFGYDGCGSLVITSHNAPNNSLPLFHHRAPRWSPLFRRVHHMRGKL